MKDIHFALQIDNRNTVFGPADTVQGTVSLTTPGHIFISEISVVFTARSAYSFSPYIISDTEHTLKQTFFRQQSVLYSSEKINPKPLSPARRHEWAFQFRFPANRKGLPPSFGHVADTSQTLSLGLGHGSRRVQSSCIVLYDLTAHLRGTDLPKYCPSATEKHYIFFWPNRYTELPDRSWPKAHRQSISVPRVIPSIAFQRDETTLLKRLRKKVTRTQNTIELDLVAHIPRYSILGQPFQVSLSISPGDGTSESPALMLESVEYVLQAITRVGRSSNSNRHVFRQIAFKRHVKNLAIPFPEASHLIHLHTTAPVTPPTHPEWSTTGGQTKGPLCPSFESNLSARAYRLSLNLTVSCNGKPQVRWFEGGEIVLLPPRLDASVKKKSLTELGEDGVAEVGGDAARGPELAAGGTLPVKAEGHNVAQEVEGENGRRQELPASDAGIGHRCLTGSGELEGDRQTIA